MYTRESPILFYQPFNLAISGQVQKAQQARSGAQLCQLEPLVDSLPTLPLAPDTSLGNSRGAGTKACTGKIFLLVYQDYFNVFQAKPEKSHCTLFLLHPTKPLALTICVGGMDGRLGGARGRWGAGVG